MLKNTIAIATFLAVGASALGVGAATLRGSDSLKELTLDLLSHCSGTSSLTYVGGGAGAGETAMVNATQQTAVVTRFYAAAGFACTSNSGANVSLAEGVTFGADGLAIVTNSSHQVCDPGTDPGNATGGEDCNASTISTTGLAFNKSITLADGSTYTLGDWKEVLRLVYFGLRNSAFKNGSATVVPRFEDRDCSDPARVALVNNWGNLFQTGCSGGSCTILQHAFARDEAANTTDVPRDLLGITGNPRPSNNACTTDTDCSAAGFSSEQCCASASAAGRCDAPTGTGDVCKPRANWGNGTVGFPLCNEYALSWGGKPPPKDGYYSDVSGHPITYPTGSIKAETLTPPVARFQTNLIANPLINTNASPTAAGPTSATTPAATGPGLPVVPYFHQYQDADPIRRDCIGNYNILASGNPPSPNPAEQVCSYRGDLGLVLPISVPNVTAALPDPYPIAPCGSGSFVFGGAVRINQGGVGVIGQYLLCPNLVCPLNSTYDANAGICFADSSSVSVNCPVPATADADARCLNGKNNIFAGASPEASLPDVARPGSAQFPATRRDGRVYNLQVRNSAGGLQSQSYPYAPYGVYPNTVPGIALPGTKNNGGGSGGPAAFPPTQATVNRAIVGAFYRIHSTRTAIAGAAATCPGGFNNVNGPCCTESIAAAPQIACVTSASPCSIAYEARPSLQRELPTNGGTQTLIGLSLNSVSPANAACIVGPATNFYPFSRLLYLDALRGFESNTGSFAPELALAQCFSGNNLDGAVTIGSEVSSFGFIPLPGGPECVDFNDAACSGVTGNTNACTGNPSGIAPYAGRILP